MHDVSACNQSFVHPQVSCSADRTVVNFLHPCQLTPPLSHLHSYWYTRSNVIKCYAQRTNIPNTPLQLLQPPGVSVSPHPSKVQHHFNVLQLIDVYITISVHYHHQLPSNDNLDLSPSLLAARRPDTLLSTASHTPFFTLHLPSPSKHINMLET